MSKPKHSPGPWKPLYAQRGGFGPEASEPETPLRPTVIADSDDAVVCWLMDTDDKVMCRNAAENARLIAAAPEMFELLDGVVTNRQPHPDEAKRADGIEMVEFTSELLDRLGELLKRIEGEE